MLQSIDHDFTLAPESEHEVLHRFDMEPYRQKLILMFRRLRHAGGKPAAVGQPHGQHAHTAAPMNFCMICG
ncbi:MAG: hypothetical protein R2911_17285 [Caldilineaceae bacterium]